ncbi:DNA helicase RecQ [Myxococcota bacterium]|nr:DNA helicase RecQ [Myxococcota bacterium]MBU1382049.1 DNA helicase RecQ [Myxococcota bacterium]MBU1495551.1 DNA helicase RecQ [Myxococcota bacterium]
MSKIDGAKEILKKVFGYDEFRLSQEDVIQTILDGKSAFALMPTGGGKSLIFQIPALLLEGVCICVSPLISLMKDQVDALTEAGIAAEFFNSSQKLSEKRNVLSDLKNGSLDILYVAPERLMMDDFLELLSGIKICLFAIDEAHCISTWGHDFRPEYVKLGRLRRLFPDVPFVALTATADIHTRRDIIDRLHLDDAEVFISSFDRPNIRYRVISKYHPIEQLVQFIRHYPNESGIVYALSRAKVEETAAKLVNFGYSAAPYHAGLSSSQRQYVQDEFLKDNVKIIVATVAFGMGIDKSNVRYVVHFDMPANIEGYYQETGRAGRDGLPSEALLLFGYGDVNIARSLIEKSDNSEQIRIKTSKLNLMVAYAENTSCRRRSLLNYFGENPEHDCGNCDNCLDPVATIDATEDARKALSCVYRTGQSYGITYLISVLRGAHTAQISQRGHDQLSVFGIGQNRPELYWQHIFRQLIHHGFLFQDISRYNILTLLETARPLLKGEITFLIPEYREKTFSSKKEKSRKKSPLPAASDSLFDKLRILRKDIAAQAGKPPFVIFSDMSLHDMARKRPVTNEEFLDIYGVGQAKLSKYGREFMDLIRIHCNEEPE